MGYVTQKGLKNLEHYHYSGVDNSLIAKYIMQPFWNSVVHFLPAWMAPNLVTLIGFLFIIFSYITTAYYHPMIIGGGGPRILYLSNAICMIIYQTMDALDGKQARRTKTSSPLGELFDHGCDAVTTVLQVITISSVLQLDYFVCFLSGLALMSGFYFAQWEEYYTGSLILGVVGVTEGQLISIALYTCAYFVGPMWWATPFFVPLVNIQITYGSILAFGTIFTACCTIPSNIYNVYQYQTSPGRGGILPAIITAVPIVVASGGFALWAAYTPSNVYHLHPQAFICAYGFLVAGLVGRIVLDRVTQQNFPALQSLLLPLLLVPVVIYTNIISEKYYVYMYAILMVVAYFHFALSVIHDLCAALKIRCLHIPDKPISK
eukprot:TRINITY_DN14834_c0_g1_i1.p1 TRINITY_DN14834_c0_g1~~TRINITY_DN14834_c0_g1_i1.p1  ORF type:complete len:376 (+),score=91.83 TRINITY_DN14834_c0_g1_i1:81-1208(+)